MIAPSSRPEPSVSVEVARAPDKDLQVLFERALTSAEHQRGGALLLASILAGRSSDAVFRESIDLGALFVARGDNRPLGFALVRADVIEAVFVDEPLRRRGIARSLVSAIVAARREVLDAYALPGDRAIKSLYESFGWKARLLTMRAE